MTVRCCSSPTKMLEELGLKKLQERRSNAKLKMLHSFYSGYKFVTPPLLPLKARNANLCFKPIAGCVRVELSAWNNFLIMHLI